MQRREFIALLGVAAAWPRAGLAQGASRRPLVAFLAGQTAAYGARYSTVLVQRMKDLGHVEGRSIDFAFFHADGDMARLPALAAELLLRKPDVVVATNIQAVVAMKQATNLVPIVGTVLSDPEALGLAETQARPGGNVTGILIGADTLPGKQLALAAEIVRKGARLGMLINPGSPTQASQRRSVEESAAALGVALVPVEARTAADLEAAFRTLARERADAVVVIGDPMFFFERSRIAALAIEARLPAAFSLREHVETGGLMSYGVDQRASFFRAAELVDKILKGTKPGDLPLELPTRFELVINLKTAKAIGITIPEQFLVRADEVIE